MNEFEIKYKTTDGIRNVIDSIGRTEDVKFSSDNRFFAVLEFLENKIHLFTVDIKRSDSQTDILVPGYALITSTGLKNPHGICFPGNNHMVVCNRAGDVSVFRIPAFVNDINEFDIDPETTINGDGFLTAKVKTPGSVDCYEIAENRYRILVCNNYWNMVTSHIVEIGNTIRVRDHKILLENSLQIPDGISVSPDKQWISVSNHVHGEVLIYRNSSNLNRNTPPDAILKGPVCPHGVRFSPDGKRLLVADAASQYLHVYDCEDGDWSKIKNPARAINMLDEEVFYTGRYTTREGGIKGIDTDNSGSLLVSTHEKQVIGFYNLNSINETDTGADSNEMEELRRQRDISLNRHDKDVLNKHWTLSSRVKGLLENKYLHPVNYRNRLKEILISAYLQLRNKTSSESLLDPSGPVLSLTSHGRRIETVFHVIESIGLGHSKPSRIILWISDKDLCSDPPESLEHLKSRGLEIRHCEDYGPHTKYYPYIEQESALNKPLVTADDDILYPPYWLEGLISAHNSDTSVIHCYRAYRMCVNRGKFMPFNEWEPCGHTSPSHLNFISGESGVIYPAEFQQYLKQQGKGFLECCPKADDVWLTKNAVRSGFRVSQIKDEPVSFDIIRGSQVNSLFDYNIVAGGYHAQMIRTFTHEDISKLESDIKEKV